MRRFHNRIHPRCRRYDYRLPGMYFVTTITLGRARLFGVLTRGRCVLSRSGLAVRDTWMYIPERFPGVELDTFIVMPDHVHALIAMPEQSGPCMTSVSDVVRWAKSRSAHAINEMHATPGAKIWQTSFHDRVVRTAQARDQIRRYIELNPRRAP